ncbi:MAG: hypothetical protein WAP03_00270 [Methylorubrum rhodinum]|uniref:hypothetical protein n=1 Tax=Methylorubrum rhodinum TaxID=29428 RepID=UPI003BB052E2
MIVAISGTGQPASANIVTAVPRGSAIQRKSELAKPIGESWVVRGWKVPPVKNENGEITTPGRVNPWPRKYLARDYTVVVYLPHGGGGGGAGGGRSKSPLAIVAGIAGLALMAFAGPLAAGLAPLLGLAGASFAGISGAAFVQAGAALGSTALVPWSLQPHPVARRQRVRQLHGIRWARRRRARAVPRGA